MSDLIDEITERGFAMAPGRVPAEALHMLVASLNAAGDSEYSRKRAGHVYALRNILRAVPGVYELALSPVVFDPVRTILGAGIRPVKAILFDKTPEVNWNLRWHQDNVISVKERKAVDGFAAWSVRVGVPHVRPPAEILQQMLAARVHIDDCPEENGALQVIPGSHACGRLSPEEVDKWRADHQVVICPAQKGEILLMRPLLLHSSRPSTIPAHRRVLHIEYAGCDLPGGLEWGQ